MLGFILLYHVWKRFSELALNFGRSKNNGWYGVLAYVLGILTFGFILGILNEIFNWGIDWDNNLAVNLFEIPVGILCCYILYKILERKWQIQYIDSETINDIGKTINED